MLPYSELQAPIYCRSYRLMVRSSVLIFVYIPDGMSGMSEWNGIDSVLLCIEF